MKFLALLILLTQISTVSLFADDSASRGWSCSATCYLVIPSGQVALLKTITAQGDNAKAAFDGLEAECEKTIKDRNTKGQSRLGGTDEGHLAQIPTSCVKN